MNLRKEETPDEDALKENEIPKFIEPIMESLLHGGEIDLVKYLEILSYLINRNIVQLKGFVYAIEDGMYWQNLELVLAQKVNYIVKVTSSCKDIMVNYKLEQMNKNEYLQK